MSILDQSTPVPVILETGQKTLEQLGIAAGSEELIIYMLKKIYIIHTISVFKCPRMNKLHFARVIVTFNRWRLPRNLK